MKSRRGARFKLAQQSRACYTVRVMCGVAELVLGFNHHCFFLFFFFFLNVIFHNDS